MAFHETIEAGEAAELEGFASEIRDIQRRRAPANGKAERALHVNQRIGVVGELTVTAPPDLATGVFATPGQRYPVYVRLSNGSSRRQSDKAPDARGFALKLVGVPGQKLIPGLEQAQTQDFLMIAEPAIAFRDPREFMIFVRSAKDGGPLTLVPRLLSGYGWSRGFAIIKRLLGAPSITSFATHPFFTAAPIAYGASAAKVGIVPLDPREAPAKGGPDGLRDDFIARLREGALKWSLRVQLFADDATTPIEDASVVWPTPWREVGTFEIPAQDLTSPAAVALAERVNGFSFDPWHALVEHRPLGGIMRARAVAYRESVLGRAASPEPVSILPG